MSEFAIQTDGITRYFGAKCAVDQVNLRVPRGAVFALLGRNGSGKTTLIRMLLGMLEPTRGASTVLGISSGNIPPQGRGRIGYVAEGHPLIDWMRIGDLEAFQKGFYAKWNHRLFQNVMDHFGLGAKTRAGTLSRGQRAGLSLALVLATEPELLVMDDPALGLDPVARRTLLEAMILVTRNAGNTIFFTSHVLDDVERVADHVGIMDKSVLRLSCSVETFRERVKRMTLTFAGKPPAMPRFPGLLQARREGNEIEIICVNYAEEGERIVGEMLPLSVTETPLTLEDAVIAYLAERGERVSLLQRTMETEVVS